MGEFRICFFGLISHIGAEGFYNHAAVLRDVENQHTPWIFFTDDVGEELTGDVSFDQSFAAVARPSFVNDVPSLQDLTGEAPVDAVQDGEPHEFVELYVYYPGGTLRSRERHNDGLLIEPATGIPKHQCVARVVELVLVDDKISTLTINYNGDQRQIASGECVLIVNAEFVDAKHKDNPSHAHRLSEHGRITMSSNFATVTKTGKKCGATPPTNCEWIQDVLDPRRFRDAVDVECTNTRWP